MARILVVEDEADIRFCYNKFIAYLGHEALLAEYIDEAKVLIDQVEFNVAVLDLVLNEGEDGIEVMKYILSYQPSCQVILVTGYPTFSRAIDVIRYNIFHYLGKPVTMQKFCQVLESAIIKNSVEKEKLLKKDLKPLHMKAKLP